MPAHEHKPIEHQREFGIAADEATAQRRKEVQAQAKETAGAYARLFSTPDGVRVLVDLRKKFGHDRPRFTEATRRSPIFAAQIDGQCDVLREIEAAFTAGGGQPFHS